MTKKERKICKFEIDFGCCSNISNDDSLQARSEDGLNNDIFWSEIWSEFGE